MYPTCQGEAANKCFHVTVNYVTRSLPSPVMSLTEDAARERHLSHVKGADSESLLSNSSDWAASNSRYNIHISVRLMEDFLELAKGNTEKDLETCGVLGAFLDNDTLYATTLIIPKQESTSNSCMAKNEEEVFAIQHEHSLIPVGWIHVMLPEAFAIVVAPTDVSRSYGIFRLSDPGGMTALRECQETGFHQHEPADGSPIYEHCTNVYTNSNLRFEIFDLR